MIAQNDLLERQKWQAQLQKLWPAVKGSLVRVKKPCIHKHCPACARGDKHPAWIFGCSIGGRRQTLHVPLALVESLAQALENGRKIERLLSQAGPQFIKQHRQNAKKRAKSSSKS